MFFAGVAKIIGIAYSDAQSRAAYGGISNKKRGGGAPRGFYYMHRRGRFDFFFVLLVLMIASPAHALKTDADQPVNIRARTVEANEKTGVAVYRGDVLLTQGSLRIQADRVEVVMRNDRLHTVHATGKPVKVRARSDRGEELRASAQRAQYNAPQQQLDLYGKVALERDRDVLNGAVVHYNVGSQDFTAEGDSDGQVSAVIQPTTTARP